MESNIGCCAVLLQSVQEGVERQLTYADETKAKRRYLERSHVEPAFGQDQKHNSVGNVRPLENTHAIMFRTKVSRTVDLL